jgi:type III secretion protein U
LSQAREKGQIAHSPDFVSALTTPIIIGYVWTAAGGIAERMQRAIEICDKVSETGFDAALRQLVPLLVKQMALILVPIFGVCLASAFAAGILANGGFIFALDPLMPKLQAIDPLKGFAKLFKMKAFIDLAKSLIKLATFIAVFVWIGRRALRPLATLPACGTGCMPTMLSSILAPLIESAMGVYITFGLGDFLIQKWIFARDMRMTRTEVKRERKDSDGDPQLKGALRRQRRESSRGGRVGVNQTTLMVCSDVATVGLRFVQGETDLPYIVCRGRDGRARALNDIARERGFPLVWDEGLAIALTTKLPTGSKIPPHLFKQVAQAIFLSGAARRR